MVKSTQNYRFNNWARNESCLAKNFYQPEDEEDLVTIIKTNSKIRVTGTGHSWNKICLTEEALINLDKFNKVIDLDLNKLQVKVQSGIKLWQLNDFLDKRGLALQNLGSISDQSVAGAVSTATHGSGIKFGVLSSQVEEFWLIKADGEKIHVHRERDKELFDLALINLGCLGIISSLTINIVPAFNLKEVTTVAPFEEVIESLDELVSTTDHFKLWWFPHTEYLVVYRYTRTNEPVNDSRLRQWFMDELVSVNAYRLMLKMGSVNRNWRKKINNALVQTFIKPLDRIEKSYKVFNVPEPPLHRETEWAFDISVAKKLLREYKRMINASSHRFNFLQEIRFTKADEYALSPCYGRNSLWLGAYNADNFGWEEILTDFELLAHKYQGRPHWGKEFKSPDNLFFRTAYPGFHEFAELRKHFDPENKFTNAFISKIFEV